MSSTTHAVRTSGLIAGSPLPLLATPAGSGLDLPAWLRANRTLVDEWLVRCGGVLFRGFGVDTPDAFHAAAAASVHELMAYTERSSPRTLVQPHVYTSTDYPPDQPIFPHNEHSYASRFPTRIAFGCIVPATSGGDTPLADCRRLLSRIPAPIQEAFARRGGWMYVRTLGDEIGLSWKTVYQTDDRAAVEAHCRHRDTLWEWKSNNRLRTVQVRPAVARHPRTRDAVWFNHATFFNVGTLPDMLREFLLEQYAIEDLPNNTYYGDGTPLEPDTLRTLQDAYRAELVAFRWERGDYLLLDNMLTAHGRDPFEGPRTILASMGDPIDRAALPA